MEKKDLKFYAAPASEVVELNVEAQILAGSDDPVIPGGGSQNIDPENIDPGFGS